MREILFRGKRFDNGEWIEGSLFTGDNGECEICCGTPRVRITYEVIPETVGQFTGLYANGTKIFEGDILAQNWYDIDGPADDSFGEVVFSVADCSFSVLDLNKNEIMPMGHGCAYHYEVEVIGNIHDNPELLKGETE